MNIKKRQFWLQYIENSWKRRSVLWLSGVRRVGKTCLCQSLQNVEYFDCELPSTRREMENPEAFLESCQSKRIVLDEIHRLGNPSELLKIASDHYPEIKVIATGYGRPAHGADPACVGRRLPTAIRRKQKKPKRIQHLGPKVLQPLCSIAGTHTSIRVAPPIGTSRR